MDTQIVNDMFSDFIEPIVGDTPVSVQIATALERTASKDSVSALYDEVEALKKKIDILTDLVGDTPVSEQIFVAIKNI